MRTYAFGTYKSSNKHPDRNSLRWLEIVLGILLGFAIGLSITWGLAPNSQVDPSPAALREDFKDRYRLLVATAYVRSGDIERARVRLTLLQDPDPVQALLDQAQRIYTPSTRLSSTSLSMLADAIQRSGQPIPTPISSPTNSPIAPTNTWTSFQLVTSETICDPGMESGLTKILVQGITGQPLPGIQIQVAWDNNVQTLFTGFKPELGDGYADFIMLPGLQYTIRVIPSSEPVSGLAIPECSDGENDTYGGGYLFLFRQP